MMRSDTVKKGLERAPHRSLMKATGLTDADISRVEGYFNVPVEFGGSPDADVLAFLQNTDILETSRSGQGFHR